MLMSLLFTHLFLAFLVLLGRCPESFSVSGIKICILEGLARPLQAFTNTLLYL